MWGDSYNRGKNTGHNDGTMGGMLGAVDYNRNKQSQESYLERHLREEREAKEKARRKAKQDDSAKVICTELHRQGLMGRADYALGAEYARAHLTDRHYRGYHAWALAVVRHMRRSKRASAFWRTLAQARADHIAYLHGDATRRNRFGAVLCAVGYPTCYLIGGLIGERDWRALYEQRNALDSELV
ncbi:hypothetical protein KYK29_15620 [Shinella daejeonensis]|uniref:hypothetical protein n=1 Tax=Shinella daejeonensis TaxID=659017 RepID=UPI0020C7F98A|nr:hypothetical protein [Shinella daejeonensis]MCP8896356.1 hypothetical protein [Shinella daejeonensis]